MSDQPPRLADAQLALLAGPLAVQVAAANPRLKPETCRGWGVALDDDVLTFLLVDAQSEALQRTFAPSSPVAVNVTHPVTLQSLQFKGTLLEVEAPSDAACAEVARRLVQFEDALASTGLDRQQMKGLEHEGAARRVTMRVREIYDQTPGPGAGKLVGAQ